MNLTGGCVSLLRRFLLLLSTALLLPGTGSAHNDRAFQMGPLGGTAKWASAGDVFLTVAEVPENTPAHGILDFGDRIYAANGVDLNTGLWRTGGGAVVDLRIALGNAITEAEASDGKVRLRIQAEGASSIEEVTVTIPVIGAYAEGWPLNGCPKSQVIIDGYADYIMGRLESTGIGDRMRWGTDMLFLLSTGQSEHLDFVVNEVTENLATKEGNHPGNNNTWRNSYYGIALAEYYLRTGDDRVLRHLQGVVDNAYEHDANGAWGHWDYPSPDYVGSGMVNAAGGAMFVAMVLARECGVAVKDEDFEKSLLYFYRFAGYGSPEYGDHRPSPGGGGNGKMGMVGVGCSLLPEPYALAGPIIGMQECWNNRGFEGGHTGNWTNMLWRALAAPHAIEERSDLYHGYIDDLRWYFDLARTPSGALVILPGQAGTQFSGSNWGSATSFNYTAGRKKLRMTGAPPTQYSASLTTPEIYPKSEHFFRTAPAAPYTDADFEANLGAENLSPGVITTDDAPLVNAKHPYNPYRSRLGGKRKDLGNLPEYLLYLHHFLNSVRVGAAYQIGYFGDEALPDLKQLITTHEDDRVRQAALMALTGTSGFHMDNSNFHYTEAGLVAHGMDQVLLDILRNPDEDLWIHDAALFAFEWLPEEVIGANLDALRPFLTSPHWWVRVPTFACYRKASDDVEPDDIAAMVECFVRETHLVPRTEMRWRLGSLIRSNEKLSLPENAEIRANALEALGKDFMGGHYPRDHAYQKNGSLVYERNALSVLEAFSSNELVQIDEELNAALANFGHPVLASNKNEQRMSSVLFPLLETFDYLPLANLGPFIPGIKALDNGGLDVLVNWSDNDYIGESRSMAQDLVSRYEGAFGKVSPASARTIDYSTPAILGLVPATPDDRRLLLRFAMEEGSGTHLLNSGMWYTPGDATLTDATAWSNTPVAPVSSASIQASIGHAVSTQGRRTTDFKGRRYSVCAWVRLDPGLPDAEANYVAVSAIGHRGWNLGVERREVDGTWRNVPFFKPDWDDKLSAINDSTGRTDIFLEEGKNYFIAYSRDRDAGVDDPEFSLLHVLDVAAGKWWTHNGGIAHEASQVQTPDVYLGIGDLEDNSTHEPSEATRFPGLIDEPQLWRDWIDADELFTIAQRGSLVDLANVPEVVALEATDVLAVGATANALVTPIDDELPSVRFYYDIVDRGVNPNDWPSHVDANPGSGEVSAMLTGLEAETTYFYRAYASSISGGTMSLGVSSFTTPFKPDPPQIAAFPITIYGHDFANCTAQVTDDGGEAAVVTLVYDTTDKGTSSIGDWEHAVALGLHSGDVLASLTELRPNTDYVIRFNAVHYGLGDDAWSDPVLLTTSDPLVGHSITSVIEDVGWMTPELWGGLAPVNGDENTWRLVHHAVGQAGAESFLGGTLIIGDGGGLIRTLSDGTETWRIDNLIIEDGGTTMVGSANRSNYFIGNRITLHDGATIQVTRRSSSYSYNYWVVDEAATVDFVAKGNIAINKGPGGFADLEAFRGTLRLTGNVNGNALRFNFDIPRAKASIKLKIVDEEPEVDKRINYPTRLDLADGRDLAFVSFDVRRVRISGGDGDRTYEPSLGEALDIQEITIPPRDTPYTYNDLESLDPNLIDVFIFGSNRTGTIMVTGPIAPGRPAVQTLAATANDFQSVVMAGDVTDTGGEAPVVHFYYGQSDGGTNPASWDGFVEVGVRSGVFEQAVGALPEDVAIYYRARATNSAGTTWADSTESIRTYGPPEVEVLAATDIDFDTGTLHGIVNKSGGNRPQVTLYYGPSDGGTDPEAWESFANKGSLSDGQTFQQVYPNLQPSTVYYFAARAVNAAGESWSPVTRLFTTLNAPDPASLTQDDVSNLTDREVTIACRVDDTGGDPPLLKVFYGLSDGGTDAAAWDQSQEIAANAPVGEHSKKLIRLERGMPYFFRVRASNYSGETWADSSGTFTTLPSPYPGIIPITGGYFDFPAIRSGDVTYYRDLPSNDWQVNGTGNWKIDTNRFEHMRAQNLGNHGHRAGRIFDLSHMMGTGWDLVFRTSMGGGNAQFKLNLWVGKDDGDNSPDDIALEYRGDEFGRTDQIPPNDDIVEGSWTLALELDRNQLKHMGGNPGFYHYALPADLDLSDYDIGAITFVSVKVSGDLDSFGFHRVASLPEIATLPESQLRATSVTCHGEVTETGGELPRVTLYFGEEDGGTTPAAWDGVYDLGYAKGYFSKLVAGLISETNYFYTFKATNSAGDVWANASQMLTTPESGHPYDGWAENFLGFADTDRSADFELDGISNFLEWLFGGNPTESDDAAISPELERAGPAHSLFVFRRNAEVLEDPTLEVLVEYGSDHKTWRNHIDHGTADGLVVNVEEDHYGPGLDRVSVTIPDNASPDGRLFVRLTLRSELVP